MLHLHSIPLKQDHDTGQDGYWTLERQCAAWILPALQSVLGLFVDTKHTLETTKHAVLYCKVTISATPFRARGGSE